MQTTPTQLPLNPASESHPTSAIPHPTLPSLSPDDRQRLSLLFRARGDPVSFAALREEDPLEILVWLCLPHIKPWHDAIRNAHRDHEATETHLSLARALRDITRILDLEADSKLRIRAVNAIIKLANAIHRGSKHPNFRAGLDWAQQANRHHQSNGGPFPTPPNQAAKLAAQAVRADTAAGDALLSLNLHAERRAHRDANLNDAKAPPGALFVERVIGLRDALPPTPTDAVSPIGPIPISPIRPVRPISPTLNGPHLNGKHTARASTPRPPPTLAPDAATAAGHPPSLLLAAPTPSGTIPL